MEVRANIVRQSEGREKREREREREREGKRDDAGTESMGLIFSPREELSLSFAFAFF